MSASEFIQFIDYNKHRLNIKCGSVQNNYTTIIITTVQDPEYIYEKLTRNNDEPKKQWMRRINIIHIE